MPAKNVIKTYASDSFYHVYNRGVNKMNIFNNNKDYRVFLNYLKTYLLPKDTDILSSIITNPNSSQIEKAEALKLFRLNNFYKEIRLVAYCLMPNHFHFLIKQKSETGMEKFMRSLMTRYTSYFNKQNGRIGPLFQGIYKAVIVETNEQLLHLTRYIHRNPLDLHRFRLTKKATREALFAQPSSYSNYLKKIKQEWVKPDNILSNFSKSGFNSYKSFVESTDSDQEISPKLLNNISID